jgi:major type 1 subunit fimbrin (pilin)
MKIKFAGLFAAALSLAALAPAISQAADGTITFQGNITAQTCKISGNGGGKDFTVTLPTVSTSSLTAAGATAGRTPFRIALTECSGSGNVATYFEPGPTIDTTTGQLKSNGTATNVQVGLLNNDFSKIMLGAAQSSQNSKPIAIASGAANLDYVAQYVATGAATAGAVNSSVMYTIIYP